jgi:outer membrane immunogenic protein
MRSVLFGVLFSVFAANGASAADLYDVPAPMIAPEEPAFDWERFYVGVHAGYGWAGGVGGVDRNDPADDQDDTFFESSVNGPVLGGQLGLDWQWNSLVLGAEADLAWTGVNADEEHFGKGDVVDYLGSARLRAGAALDRFLVYGTGGVGVAGISDPLDDDDGWLDLGWTAGAGAEYLVSNRMSVGVQYQQYGFGDRKDEVQGSEESFDGRVKTLTARFNLELGAF